jgi:FkbM family methyltransferase
MIIPLSKIVADYELHIKGVLHVGAHVGQEYPDYIKAGIKNMIFFEPVKSTFAKLISVIGDYTNAKAYNYALGNENGHREMFIETVNQGMSNSLLEPGTHLTTYPNITFPTKEIVEVRQLDTVHFPRFMFNMICMDVQGFELEVLKGAEKTLNTIDIIYTEINTEDVYKNCAHVDHLDSFLSDFGFTRVLTQMACKSWGDALYLKQL